MERQRTAFGLRPSAGWILKSSLLFASLFACQIAAGQSESEQFPGATSPIVGIRNNLPATFALENIDIVVRPGKRIEGGTILLRDGAIVAVGENVEIPEGTERLDRSGHIAYAGLIDAYSEVEVPDPSRDAGAPHWNGNIMPQRSAASVAASGAINGTKLRSQGITVRLVAPEGGIVKGTSCTMLTGDGESGELLLSNQTFHHLALTVPRRRAGRDSYPNSPMGAVALLRQTLLDTNWYSAAKDAYRGNGSLPRPNYDAALETLAAAMGHSKFVVDAPNERMAKRADNLAKEFAIDILIRGSGREYRQLEEIAATGRVFLLPVDFPDAPAINNDADARETSLQALLDWEFAPSNPARLADAGITFCLTTDGLSDPDKFLSQVRKAVAAGLDANEALAAVTTTPAQVLGIADRTGTIEAGKLANLVVVDGELFDEKTKTIETWVAGQQYVVTEPEKASLKDVESTWIIRGKLEADEPDEIESLKLVLKKKGSSVTGTLAEMDDEDEDEDHEDKQEADEQDNEESTDETTSEQKSDEEKPVDLTKVTRERDRVTAAVDLSKIDDDFARGISWLTLLTSNSDDGLSVVDASFALPDGTIIKLEVAPHTQTSEEPKATDESDAEESEEKEGEKGSQESDSKDGDEDSEREEDDSEDEADADEDEDEDEEHETDDSAPELTIIHPLGAYGISEAPSAPAMVVFRNATVWTCGEAGILEDADVLIVDGRFEAVGKDLQVPEGCQEIDVTGKHLTPGLIDCHSHMATDGGVNESGETITAEVRIQDFIDNSDISIYRQLAGGLTSSNILHGSANPIGGQNQVLKLRWGGTMEEMLFEDAPKGIKFALGENVKRSSGRYPDTRMGVEQIVRDQLMAATEYAEMHRRYRAGDRSTLPPRTDLQLEAIAEILAGERWIHCHSYRQDEIVALLDTLEEFGIQIGSLQHILEGYKVADRMAQHGATASSFSDWWAYKFEVFDAIPHNGAIMHDAGLIVSFNSDDAELARHMNTEAAKAVKYGGVSPEEALKFVTLNPAKQLRIDDRVGSIEVGKDADLVVWSRQPLSTMTRCEQTWIDGRCYFSLEKDAELQARDASWRSYLIQKVLGGLDGKSGARQSRVEEEDRWHRHDIYCGHHGHDHEGETELAEGTEHLHSEEQK